MLPDPVSTLIVAPLAKKVTGAILGVTTRGLRRFFEEPERRKALDLCSEAGILAMVRAVRAQDGAKEQS